MSQKRPLYECYSPKAILLGSKEFNPSEVAQRIIDAYCSLSTEFKPETWEQVAEKIDMPKDRSAQFKIVAVLNLAAKAYRDLSNQPESYIVQEPEE